MSEQTEAFKVLIEVGEQSRAHARGLPARADVKPHWSGIGFSLFGRKYVSPMGEVVEMLEMPKYTRLPGVTGWVKGVANVRGRLLPLTDMAAFLGGKLASAWREQRVLVVELDEIYCGLVVDTVFGMQHFPVDGYSQSISSELVDETMAPFMQGAFTDGDGEEWAVFSPWTLVRSEKFFQAALVA